MGVTAKSDYALRALIEIARRDDGAPVSAEELGRLQDIPHGFLQAIFADVRRAVDGPLASVYGLRPEAVNYNESASVLQLVWIAGRSSLRDVFEQVSVRQLAEGKMPKAVTSRTSHDDAWQ